MSATSVRLPESLHKKVREVAHRDNVAINQVITLAVAEKLSALETEDYLGKRARHGGKAEFNKVMQKISSKGPEKEDRL